MDTFLWVVVPYACLTGFVVGHLWQYRYDKFGWTTRSSQQRCGPSPAWSTSSAPHSAT